MKLYIGNLSFNITEEDLRELFSPYGDLDTIQLITDRQTGQSKGFGFAEMLNNSHADAAIKALNESEYKGRKIKVNQAQPRKQTQRKPPRY